MKKTLALLAILGAIAQAQAEIVTMKGVDVDNPNTYYSPSKYLNYTDGEGDWSMCWAAGAAATIEWWQDRVEENGACIIGANVPRGEDVWRQIRSDWKDKGGQPPRAMQFWLSGVTGYSNLSQWLTDKGMQFAETGGYYPHLLGTRYDLDVDQLYFPAEECVTRYLDFNGHNSTSYGDAWVKGRTTYEGASKQLVELLKEGYGGALNTGNHVMAFYQVETNDEGNIIKIWYHDNNSSSNALRIASVEAGSPLTETGGNSTYATVGYSYGNKISSVALMKTSGLQFDTYDLTMTGSKEDETLFSHYLNITIDGHQDYQLKYDLRNAKDNNSPVTAKDEDGNRISTGDIKLKSGKLSLIDCDAARKELDGGGKTSGTITFDGTTDGTKRTLSVQHTDTIAKEIKINATDSNTLEVAENSKASFGKLTGEGNLDKRGLGAAEVTDAVTLKGEIRVKEGDFIFGQNVVLTGDTRLSVSNGAHVQGKDAAQPVTLSITSGVHVNDGELTLTTTMTGGTLKGSGTFAMVTIDGGEMIVGNSPGHQNYEGALTLNSGRLVFCAAGLDTANDGDNTGWASGTYSTINMNGYDFVVNQDGKIVIALSADAANSLTTANGTVELTLATGLKSGAFSEEQLAALAAQTSFELSVEEGAGSGAKGLSTLNAPKFSYKMVDDALVLTTGVSGGSPAVPEPATGTLSLLALAGLCARRRRK